MDYNGGVPFLDLAAAHAELEEELVAIFRQTLHSSQFIGGPAVEQFEKGFAAFCQTRYCVGVGSGTDAVRFALMAAGVQPDDAVVTVANTFIATTEAISQAGAFPEFVDIDERTYNMDAERLGAYLDTQCDTDRTTGKPISRRTGRVITAVVPVHLYGQPADMDAIVRLAEAYHLVVVEDACQAHGAEYFSRVDQRWRRAGAMGKAAAFSFYPGKNLGACGEAGAVTTNDEEIARKIRMLRDHGQAQKYYHDIEGYNGRLDALQAGILRAKLKHLESWNEKRRQLARAYSEGFASAGAPVITPFEPNWARPAYHLYVIRVDDRQSCQAELSRQGIGTGIHYPVPLHEQKAYAYLGFKHGDFPVTENLATQIISLPMFPGLTADQQRNVVDSVAKFVSRRAEHSRGGVVAAD